MGAYQGIIVACAISFAVMFISSLLFGRVFCGWACPAGGVQEICFNVKDSPVKRGNWVKFLIWIPWMGTIIFLFIRAGGIQKVEPLFQMSTFISIDNPFAYIIYYSFLTLIVVLSLTVGKRSFCHHVCWMAPFMMIGRSLRNTIKWPSLRLKSEKEKCINCKLCTKKCPMSLEVEDMVMEENMENSECILCGMCADVCNKDVIHYSFSSK